MSNNIQVFVILQIKMNGTTHSSNHFQITPRNRLVKFLDNSPPRLIGTRWKVYMVLNRYLALAWQISNNTWTFIFEEREFIKEYKDLFGAIDPSDALRASILAFLEEPDI